MGTRITIDPVKFKDVLAEHRVPFREMLRDVARACDTVDSRFYPLNKILKENLTSISSRQAKLLLRVLVPHTPVSLEEIRSFITFDADLEAHLNRWWTSESMESIKAGGLKDLNWAKRDRMKEALTSYILAYDDIIKHPWDVIRKIKQLLDEAIDC